MGEKRKARMSNNERASKKEKIALNSVAPSTSNDDVEEQSSMHSNSSNSDNNSQQTSATQETPNVEEIEESQTIAPIDIENITNEEHIELKSTTNDTDAPNINTESIPTTKSWWSSFFRFFHFGHATNETKHEIDSSGSPYVNGTYLSNVKCRRSLHGDSLIG